MSRLESRASTASNLRKMKIFSTYKAILYPNFTILRKCTNKIFLYNNAYAFYETFCSNNEKLWNEPSPRKLNLTFDLEEPEMQQIPEVIEKPETTEISIEATLGDERFGWKFVILCKNNI